MGKSTTRSDGNIHITTYHRRPFSHRRSINDATARICSYVQQDGVMHILHAVATFTLISALLLPILSSSSSAVDIETVTRASIETTRLRNDANGLSRSVSLNVPALLQNPELPTGCESVALTNALLFYGFDLTKTEIADAWLPTSDTDFVDAFMGSPFSPDGHATMAPAIVHTATSYLEAQGSSLTAIDLTGNSLEDILTEVDQGYPVIAWCTIELEEPNNPYMTVKEYDRTYHLFANTHTVVVRGYDLDANVIFVSDSLSGQVTYDLETFAARYYALGSQAVVIK